MCERKLNRFHVFHINSAPHSVRMATNLTVSSFLLVKDNGTRLARQAEGFFGAGDSIFKILRRNIGIFWRVEGQGKQVLPAFCPPADGLTFLKCRQQIIGRKAAYVMNDNTLILIFHEMTRQISRTAPLIANKNHGTRSVLRPSAITNSARMAATSVHAILIASAVAASILIAPFSTDQFSSFKSFAN